MFGSTSGTFNITNSGTLNGNVNVTGSNAASTFANSGTWNAGTANSTFSGSLNNTGTVNVQNGAAGQVDHVRAAITPATAPTGSMSMRPAMPTA